MKMQQNFNRLFCSLLGEEEKEEAKTHTHTQTHDKSATQFGRVTVAFKVELSVLYSDHR